MQALGNHEFEDGLENLIEYIKRLNHPMLVANLDASMEPSMQSLIKKSTVIERGGKKIGIIGALLSGVTVGKTIFCHIFQFDNSIMLTNIHLKSIFIIANLRNLEELKKYQ